MTLNLVSDVYCMYLSSLCYTFCGLGFYSSLDTTSPTAVNEGSQSSLDSMFFSSSSIVVVVGKMMGYITTGHYAPTVMVQ